MKKVTAKNTKEEAVGNRQETPTPLKSKKLSIGKLVNGYCKDCKGRGRKEQHLEYFGGGEVICLVCGQINNIGVENL